MVYIFLVFKNEIIDFIILLIKGPTHKTLKAFVTGDPKNGYDVEFTPVEVGDHAIDVKIAGSSIPGCPFLVKAYDSKKVRISEITSGTVGKPIYFSSLYIIC